MLPGLRLKQTLLSISRQAERDIAQCIPCCGEQHVHALRLRMKKLHALLLLVESRGGSAAMEAIRRDMRTLRKAFAASRDQSVMEALLAKLGQSGNVRVPGPLRTMPNTGSGHPPDPRRLRGLLATAGTLTRRLKSLRLRALTREDIAAAFASHYKEVQLRHELCLKKPSSKRMHHWRKVVKDHYFHSLLLLRDRRRCTSSRKVGAILGGLQDCAVLLEQCGDGVPDDLHDAVTGLMEDLHDRAFHKARRLLVPAPAKLQRQALKACHWRGRAGGTILAGKAARR